jgi:hypothetical protein
MSTCPPDNRDSLKPLEIDIEHRKFPLFVSMHIRNGVGLSRDTINAILTSVQFRGINPVEGLVNNDGELVTTEDLQDGIYTRINANPASHERRIENAGYANDPIQNNDWSEDELNSK